MSLCDETGCGVRIVGYSEETVVVHLQSNCQIARRDANGGGAGADGDGDVGGGW
jgi:hypothetical protein